MNLPKNAIKNHEFYLFIEDKDISKFICSKCKIMCIVPDNQYWKSFLPQSKAYKYKNQNFFFAAKSWDEVDSLNNLSCAECVIRNIII